MKPLAPKTNLQNRYIVQSIIGKGGMGEVYLATDIRLRNDVALKRTTVGDDEQLAAAFEREARTLAGLRHPVLPKVSDHFLENDEQFLVMDYISGDDLSKRLKESNKPFPLNWVLFWADQLLDALSYLHTHNPPIIHRDIKPQNLKLTNDNQIVLLDFGLSKNAIGETRVTTSGSVVGYTPHYAPMEQIRGTGTDARSDIYALSATLYQLMTGIVPADALTRADSILSSLPDPLEPLNEANPEISEALSSAVLKGMDLSQDKRFADARDMQKALRRAYNAMQQSMNAETVAFKVSDEVATPEDIFSSDAKTEVGMDIVVPPVEVPEPTVEPGEMVSEMPSGDKTEAFNASEITPPADLDATIQVSDPSELVSGVAAPDAFGSDFAEDSTPSDAPASFETSDDFGAPDQFESIPTTGSEAVADATVPLIGMDGADSEDISFGAEDLGTDDDIPSFEPEYDEADGAESENAGVSVPSVATATAGAKKSGGSSIGKYIAILLGIGFVLFLLVGSVAAGLWYYTSRGDSESVQPTVEATPEATIEATPTPEITPEEGNTNTENVNSDVNSTIPVSTPTPAITEQPKSPPKRVTPTPKPATPKPKQVTPKPPTPKPIPKKKDPGVL